MSYGQANAGSTGYLSGILRAYLAFIAPGGNWLSMLLREIHSAALPLFCLAFVSNLAVVTHQHAGDDFDVPTYHHFIHTV